MTDERCAHCPLAADLLCPRWPTNHTAFCDWADPGHPGHAPNAAEALTRIALGRAGTPLPPECPPTTSRSSPAPSIPLAGDLVAALTARIGADRAAKWIAAKLGTDCRCAARQARLNSLDRTVRRWLRIG